MSDFRSQHHHHSARGGPSSLRQAVAMRYDAEHERAPRLLAKGQGTVADRILDLAKLHGIPLFHDDDLVNLLGVLDINAEIPPRLYQVMAEVLAHVYRMNGQQALGPQRDANNRPSQQPGRGTAP